MKKYYAILPTVLLLGASILGLGAITHAQQGPRDSQQPMEIPAQYPPQPGGPDQYDPQQQGQDDGGAARVSYIRGDVATQHSDSSEWIPATLNTPVINGDRLSTGRGSRAEIQLDYANILRMSDESTANVVDLSRSQMKLQIGQGLGNFDVLKGSDTEVEIETPNVSIRPLMGEGSFRILVNSDGETIVDVRRGSAEISTPQGSTRVERNQRITIQGNADDAQYRVSGSPGTDDWDKWNNDRDHSITSAESWQHTNPYYTGSQDLDSYGHWNNVPEYGSVWFPDSADSGWAPYRDGRWVYEPYYGWTWVSYEPWGWAPYHYGRWFVYGGNWGWWPGPVYGGYRPVWAPAYVSFLGFGGGNWGVDVGFGFGGGFGNIGWLPCGPGDRYYPWYGRGGNRVTVVNVYNRNNYGGFAPLRGGSRGYSNFDRAFNDDHVRGGISSMRADQFGRGRVPRQQERFDSGSFRQARMITGANPVSPSRESFRSSDRQINPGALPNRAGANQRFFNNSRQNSQQERGQAGPGRNGNFAGNRQQQNTQRPGFRSFGSRDSGGQTPPAQDQGRNAGNRQDRSNSGANSQQQNTERPGFRSFGSRDSGNSAPSPNQDRNVNPGYRQGRPAPGASQPQQNMDRSGSDRSNPGFRGYGSRNPGYGNEGAAPAQVAPSYRGNSNGQRSYAPPEQRQEYSAPYGRGRSSRSNEQPPSQYQPYPGGRNYEGQGGGQSRSVPMQQPEPQMQYQNNSRGNPGNYGYSRPPLVMQQPVVTPRGERSAPPPRAAPSGGYNNRPSDGGYRGNSGGGSRGGSQDSRGGDNSSGRGHGRH